VMVDAMPSVFFSADALADLDRISMSYRYDHMAPLNIMLKAADAISERVVRHGAYRTMFDRWTAAIDEVQVVYDVLSAQKIMVVGMRRR